MVGPDRSQRAEVLSAFHQRRTSLGCKTCLTETNRFSGIHTFQAVETALAGTCRVATGLKPRC